jgi:hypothetical protein
VSRFPLRALVCALLAGGALGATAAPAPALQIGISDQHSAMFGDPLFAQLHVRYGRLVVPWNIALKGRARRQGVSSWLFGAAVTGVEPHVAFNVVSYDRKFKARGPSPRQYRRAIVAFHARWPQVRVFSPWNEENHYFQPTYRRPDLAARYYDIVKKVCRGCQVLAADMLDDPNLARWLPRFKRALRRYAPHRRPRLWGLHNYQDVNHHRRLRKSWTLRLTRMVKGTIWATESGGMVGFVSPKGRLVYPYNTRRAARNLKRLLALLRAPAVRSRYQRVYVYNFYGPWSSSRIRRNNRWDSGLIGFDGRPRPAYHVLARASARSLRAAPR